MPRQKETPRVNPVAKVFLVYIDELLISVFEWELSCKLQVCFQVLSPFSFCHLSKLFANSVAVCYGAIYAITMSPTLVKNLSCDIALRDFI